MEEYIKERIELHRNKRNFCNEHNFILEARLHQEIIKELELALSKFRTQFS